MQQIDGTLSTIEMQREALEGANTNTAVLTTMNDAAKALKKANNELDVDKVAIVAVIVNRFSFMLRYFEVLKDYLSSSFLVCVES